MFIALGCIRAAILAVICKEFNICSQWLSKAFSTPPEILTGNTTRKDEQEKAMERVQILCLLSILFGAYSDFSVESESTEISRA